MKSDEDQINQVNRIQISLRQQSQSKRRLMVATHRIFNSSNVGEDGKEVTFQFLNQLYRVRFSNTTNRKIRSGKRKEKKGASIYLKKHSMLIHKFKTLFELKVKTH